MQPRWGRHLLDDGIVRRCNMLLCNNHAPLKLILVGNSCTRFVISILSDSNNRSNRMLGSRVKEDESPPLSLEVF